MPRVLIEDDTWGPYRFEKGTIFTWNAWGISHNEEEYKDNETFIPERFTNDRLYDVLKDQFGFGMGKINYTPNTSLDEWWLTLYPFHRSSSLRWMASWSA